MDLDTESYEFLLTDTHLAEFLCDKTESAIKQHANLGVLKDYVPIIAALEQAAHSGEYSLVTDDVISDEVLTILKVNGFAIAQDNRTISWSKNN